MAERSGFDQTAMDRRAAAFHVLGVTPRADAAQIRLAFRAQIRLLHADRGVDPEMSRSIIDAKRTLEKVGFPSLLESLTTRFVLHSLVPRTERFTYHTNEPIDGRHRVVGVLSARIHESELQCLGKDGERYRLPFSGTELPKQQAVRYLGQGEPGQRQGEPGDLYLWFP